MGGVKIQVGGAEAELTNSDCSDWACFTSFTVALRAKDKEAQICHSRHTRAWMKCGLLLLTPTENYREGKDLSELRDSG
jgi:hypothetical protein